MQADRHRIMVIDDHPIIHDGLKTLLSAEETLEIIDGAATAVEALEKLKENTFDLAIIDLSLGDSDGTYLIRKIRAEFPKLKMLIYTMSEEKLFAERTANAGAHGYVMKTSPPKILKEAIYIILSGNPFFAPEICERIQKKKTGRPGSNSVFDVLSNREMDIFKLIGEGLDSLAIGEKLNITRNTVDTHRINIKNKLELPNGKALDRLAYEVIKQGKDGGRKNRQAGR